MHLTDVKRIISILLIFQRLGFYISLYLLNLRYLGCRWDKFLEEVSLDGSDLSLSFSPSHSTIPDTQFTHILLFIITTVHKPNTWSINHGLKVTLYYKPIRLWVLITSGIKWSTRFAPIIFCLHFCIYFIHKFVVVSWSDILYNSRSESKGF